ncbi:hypothetical protein MMC28_004328 [Mycoblastus sanguinarius]|nr:hypothetical protein [Mycoblastus sanguinarius]
MKLSDEAAPLSRPPSAPRNLPAFQAKMNMEDLNARLLRKPERTWTPVYGRTKTSMENGTPTPAVTPPEIDQAEWAKECAEWSGGLVQARSGSSEKYRLSIQSAEYWQKEALHYQGILKARQEGMADSRAYWMEEVEHCQKMLQRHLFEDQRDVLRSSINDALYWREEALHFDAIYKDLLSRPRVPRPKSPEVVPQQSQERQGSVSNTSKSHKSPEKRKADSSRCAGVAKRQKTHKKAPASQQAERSKAATNKTSSEKPISSRLRKKS